MSTDSDDVDVRCKQCGQRLGTATVRSSNPRYMDKMRWILGRMLCVDCEAKKP